MTTIAEYRAAWVASREAGLAALAEPGLAACWHTRPAAGEDEGEAAWSPRRIAHHMVYGDWYLADGLAQSLLRLAGPRPPLEAAVTAAAVAQARLPRRNWGMIDLADPAAAIDLLARVGRDVDAILAELTDADLPLVEQGPRGPRTIGERLQFAIAHAHEHADQLRAMTRNG